MSLNIDELKKKIIYRSNYRGTKEMDKLLGKFVKKYINEDRKSTRLNSSHSQQSRMPSSA